MICPNCNCNIRKCKNCKILLRLEQCCFDNNADKFCSYECREKGGEWND